MATATTPLTLGFLTVLHENAGYLGGYLVTNQWGRPLEFRLSTAVQPNRVQQILYGETMQSYLCADLIGKTLVDKTGTAVQLLITDTPAALDLRLRLETPVYWLAPPQSPGPPETRAFALTGGRGTVHAHGLYPADLEAGRQQLEPLCAALDLGEPFGRIREAMAEARNWECPTVADAGELVVGVEAIDLALPVAERTPASFNRPVHVPVREARLLNQAPWVRALGKLGLEVSTEGWRFPVPVTEPPPGMAPTDKPLKKEEPDNPFYPAERRPRTRLRPPADAVIFKDRLLYLLQPPLEHLFAGKAIHLPAQPFPYQLEGIAFLMPRHAALLADEMGLGKTVQAILALRLLFHAGLIHRALLVCPKPLVTNWSRELRLWAEDVPFEVIGGDGRARRAGWLVSNCPLKLVNYEVLTRDAGLVADEQLRFDVVVLDEAQRIKNPDSKTAEAVKSLNRQRSWALTGTPVENKPDDLVHIFAFVDPGRIPPDTPAKRLPQLTADCILRRVKEDVFDDMPPCIIRDACLELSPAQKDAYVLAEKEGVVRLNKLGETISVQHVFELVMRLKQICNFDPLTGQSSKLEQLLADLAEVAESGRKAIIFSQWVEPLERLAQALAPFGPLQYHGKIPHGQRQGVLDRFRQDARKHVLLMSYGTGSVGLNLQFTNYVFLFDRWWNPAVEDQAINRAHRIGQKAPVTVTRFVSQGTIEERIAEVLERKRQVFNELIEQNGPPPSLGLNQEEVFGLFDLRVRPRRAA